MPDTKGCIACGRGKDIVPLLTIEYRDSRFQICSQHLPVLIHDPGQLTGRLEGAEDLSPSDIHD